MLQIALAVTAFLLALAAFAKWRQAKGRLERLGESYWELRYEYGQLRARVDRLEAGTAGEGGGPAPAEPAGKPTESFIPLSSLKR